MVRTRSNRRSSPPCRCICVPSLPSRLVWSQAGLGPPYLATGLARLARFRHPRVFLRVHPGNTAALRCYAAAGFDPVGPDQAAAWNTGQPFDYVWLIPAA
jgi:hypothetical protein